MSFNSVEFAILLCTVLVTYWSVPPGRRNGVLLVTSYVFYGWWDYRFLGLLVASTVVDFLVARSIHAQEGERRRRLLLMLALVFNLGLLGVFKYAGFFADSLFTALSSVGLSTNPVLLDIALPVGISFYTFQSISYTVEVYRRQITPAASLLTYATYVAYFPQLVAGPIERAARLLPQIERTERAFPRGARLQHAVSLIVVGLFKKVVLADGAATIVNEVFSDHEGRSWIALATAALGFSIQIYGDFAGYSNIAQGTSLLLGIELMTNFREPYLSRNITEFWQRWHISLSTWLRDYLYIPLGGNRGSQARTLRNLMLTMLLGGLWHGASWTFVAWGGLHGLYLAAHRLVRTTTARPQLQASDTLAIIGTFVVVTLTWVPFRADSLGSAAGILGGIVTAAPGAWSPVDLLTVLALAALMLAIDLAQRAQVRSPLPVVRSTAAAGVMAGMLLTALVVFSGGTPQPFIYFQF